jgi:hypothetical protein
MMLVGLCRLSHTGSNEEGMHLMFEKDFSWISRLFKRFIIYMLDKFSYLLVNNLEYWKPAFGHFASKVATKIAELSAGQLVYDEFLIAYFYDCTVIKCCRPGDTGHTGITKQSFYNGWKRHHGFKYQSLELPNGMCADLYGPMSFRNNDLTTMDESRLNERLERLFTEGETRYKAYGDGIFRQQNVHQQTHRRQSYRPTESRKRHHDKDPRNE